jgi:hypothetical protein
VSELKLLPCPWCGTVPAWEEFPLGEILPGQSMWQLRCECVWWVPLGAHNTKDEAAKLWNHRVPKQNEQ